MLTERDFITGTAPNGTDGNFEVSVIVMLQDGGKAWQNYALEMKLQPLTQDDAMAMAFGMLAFMMVISAIVGIAASARKSR